MPISTSQILAIVLPGALAFVLIAFLPRLSRHRGDPLAALAWTAALGVGMLATFRVNTGNWPWADPMVAWSYALIAVVPAVLVVAFVAGFLRVPRWVPWVGRAVIVAAGFPLVMRSLYTQGEWSEWTGSEAVWWLDGMRAGLLCLWVLLLPLADREPGRQGGGVWGRTGTGVLAMVMGFASLLCLLSGSAQYGMYGLTMTAIFVAGWLATLRRDEATGRAAAIDLFVVMLSLLMATACVFASVSVLNAALIAAAPLAMWVVRLPWLRDRPAKVLAALRIAAVAIPLIAATVLAGIDFAQDNTTTDSGGDELYWE